MEIKAKEITLFPSVKLSEYPKNVNVHTEEQIDKIIQLIDFYGHRDPLIVDADIQPDGTHWVLAGNGRLQASKKAKWDNLPIIFQKFNSEEEKYGFMVSHNAVSSSGWGGGLDLAKINTDIIDLGPDFDIEMLAIKDFVIEPIEKFEPQSDEDEVPEVVHPITRRGDLWILGNHRLYCGDSTMIDDVEKLMNGEKAELCFTSPPYSDQREYNGNKDLSVDNIIKFISNSFNRVNYYAINLGYQRKNGEVYPYWDQYINEAKNCGLKFLSWNIWDQGFVGSVGKLTAMFPINHEWIFVFGYNIKKLNPTVENKNANYLNDYVGDREVSGKTKKRKTVKIREKREVSTLVSMPPHLLRDGIEHPARFPVDLPGQYVLAMTEINEIIYEPFSGSGSTLIACEKTNRKCYGMELDEKYCDVIINRWQNYTGKKAVLELTKQTYEELKLERLNG